MTEPTSKKFIALYTRARFGFGRLGEDRPGNPQGRRAEDADRLEKLDGCQREIARAHRGWRQDQARDAGGVADVRNEIMLYSVVEAQSHEAAAKLFENHPHLQIPHASIEVMEVRSLGAMSRSCGARRTHAPPLRVARRRHAESGAEARVEGRQIAKAAVEGDRGHALAGPLRPPLRGAGASRSDIGGASCRRRGERRAGSDICSTRRSPRARRGRAARRPAFRSCAPSRQHASTPASRRAPGRRELPESGATSRSASASPRSSRRGGSARAPDRSRPAIKRRQRVGRRRGVGGER